MPLVRRGSSETAAPSLEASTVTAALASGSIDERWTAARAAAELPNGLSLLSDALSREADPRVREAIFTSITRTRTPESAAALLPYLHSDDASLRAGALDALRAMPEATAPHLPGLLTNKDADVRVLACELVRNQPVGEANRLLRPILTTESQANVCGAAVEVLAEVGGTDLLPFLAECAGRFPDDPFLGFAIQVASDRIGSQASNRG
ncbi:HEAT repeat domain-containing protein [Bradyrhizobium liaoningense]|nr:HEAT repeat domain-containing protein [Bradyrhizobium liaoningense]MBR0736997.1 HEAT repeat domain-containing protein [Bradyrhizobium liaoningense]